MRNRISEGCHRIGMALTVPMLFAALIFLGFSAHTKLAGTAEVGVGHLDRCQLEREIRLPVDCSVAGLQLRAQREHEASIASGFQTAFLIMIFAGLWYCLCRLVGWIANGFLGR